MTARDLNLDEIRAETLRFADRSYHNDGLDRSDVLWLITTIADLLGAIEILPALLFRIEALEAASNAQERL